MKAKKSLLLLLSVLALSVTLGACSSQKEEMKDDKKADMKTEEMKTDDMKSDNMEKMSVKEMKGEELKELSMAEKSDDVVIVDVRKEDEFKAGHVKNAMNVTLEQIKENPNVLEMYKDKKVALYCNTGRRSGEAAEILVQNGYMDVSNAQGVKEFSYELVTE